MANIATKSNSGWQYIEKENLLHVLFEEEFSEEEAKKYSHYFRPLKLGYQQWLALAVLKFRRNGIQSRNEIPFLHQLYLDITGEGIRVEGEGAASVRVEGEGAASVRVEGEGAASVRVEGEGGASVRVKSEGEGISLNPKPSPLTKNNSKPSPLTKNNSKPSTLNPMKCIISKIFS